MVHTKDSRHEPIHQFSGIVRFQEVSRPVCKDELIPIRL